MKTTLFPLILLGAALPSLLGQEVPTSQANEPTELTQLRNAWLLEREKATAPLDVSYLESLEAMRTRLEKEKEAMSAAAVEKEIRERLTLTPEKVARMARLKEVDAKTTVPTQLTASQSADLLKELAGKVWRVDHEGEGLRWYYFTEDGKFARRSKLTEWVWSGLNGTWSLDNCGVVVVKGIGNTSQIFKTADGSLKITMNRDGVLTVRPLHETELSYTGEGKD